MDLGRVIKKSNLKRLYLASIFLIGLPPFAAFVSFLNTHTLSKAIWGFIFVLILSGGLKTKTPQKEKTLLHLFVAFFVVQSLSILSARNTVAFLLQYEDLVFVSLFVVVSVFIIEGIKDVRNIIIVLFANGLLNLGFQFVLLTNPTLFINLGERFLHGDYLELINLNIERKRIYFEVYDEALIPLGLYFFVYEKGKKKVGSFLYTMAVSIFSFISNFRTRFLMLFVSLTGSLFAFFSRYKKSVLYIFAAIGILVGISYILMSRVIGFSVIDRLLLEDKTEDIVPLTNRIERWQISVEMGLSSPLLGVGLGNYYDLLDPMKKHVVSVFELSIKEFEFAAFYPHNMLFKVLAENGVLGLMILFLLLIYFAKKDYDLFSTDNDLAKAFSVGFWTLFAHAMLNPSFTVKFQMLFWLFRILIEKVENQKKLKLSNP